MTKTKHMARCEATGIQRVWCQGACCQDITLTVDELAVMRAQVANRRWAQPKTLRHIVFPAVWRVPVPELTVCDPDHRGKSRAILCVPCQQMLEDLTADVPEALRQLATHRRKGGKFPPRGWRKDDESNPDEAPIPFNPNAALAVQRITNALAEDNLQERLVRLSDALRYTHRIIDRPADRVITMCPDCRTEFVVADTHQLIQCTACAYSSPWDRHLLRLLDVLGGSLYTGREACELLSRAGEPLTKSRLDYLVRRHGLPREERSKPSWSKGTIVTEAVWVYRLADIRDLQAQLTEAKASSQ